MFNAFEVLGRPGSAPTEITGGVAEALIATASGLFIAIIGLVFFNSLQARVRLVVHDLETLKTMLINRLDGKVPVELAVTRPDSSAAAEAPLNELSRARPLAAAQGM
jgi:biopolymer transport protein ExbB